MSCGLVEFGVGGTTQYADTGDHDHGDGGQQQYSLYAAYPFTQESTATRRIEHGYAPSVVKRV